MSAAKELTKEQVHVLHHSLGLTVREREPYRNHFVTGEGSIDYPICMSLVELGLMVRRDPCPITGGDDLFIVTAEGRCRATTLLPPAPKLTRSQRRYQAFLDADLGISFGEFLREYGSE